MSGLTYFKRFENTIMFVSDCYHSLINTITLRVTNITTNNILSVTHEQDLAGDDHLIAELETHQLFIFSAIPQLQHNLNNNLKK